MENCVSINSKQNEIVIKIADKASHDEILADLTDKISQLSKMYQEEKTPIRISGKVLMQDEMDEIEKLITEKIEVEIKFDSPTEMGLSEIKKTYEKDTDISQTKYYKGSLRSGQKIESEGSLVIIGDVNAGAEVIAVDNIIVIGTLRGLAHAGAKGNKKAIISASSIDTKQLRIANLVKEIEPDEIFEKKYMYVSIQNDDIVVE